MPTPLDDFLRTFERRLMLSPQLRAIIRGELEDHIHERFQELQEEGLDAPEAIEALLQELGDMNGLATAFSAVPYHKPLPRRWIMRTVATSAAAAAAILVLSVLLPLQNTTAPAGPIASGPTATHGLALQAGPGLNLLGPSHLLQGLPFLIQAGANGVPAEVNHQGVVTVNGLRYTGTGHFRFALIDPDTGLNVWTNDGSNVGGTGSPLTPVDLTVTDGIYAVRLGNTSLVGMTALSPTLFNDDNLKLRVWFDDGNNGVQALTPDHTLASSPYAFMAASIADGAVTAEKLAGGAVSEAKLAANAVTTGKIADQSITLAKLADDSAATSPIFLYANDTALVLTNACCSATTYVEPSFSVTVPAGKAYDYDITYSGYFRYGYGDRNGTPDSFYAAWNATMQDNSLDISTTIPVVTTGYRMHWGYVGGSAYWTFPYSARWYVRLGPGTHSLRVRFSGYSDNTMNLARIEGHRIQILRVH